MVTLSSVIMFPTALKLSHIFSQHEHEICENHHTTTHFHKTDVDCEFYKFNLNNPVIFSSTSFDCVEITYQVKHNFLYYSFLSYYKQLHFELRRPPSLV